MSNNDDNKVTHFGYQQVPWQEKQQRVAGVFRSVAAKYDVMNDLISMGSHRVLKRMTLELAGVRPGQKVLDLAGGTGDLAIKFSRLVGDSGQVVLADINDAMLAVGRDRLRARALPTMAVVRVRARTRMPPRRACHSDGARVHTDGQSQS